MLIEMLSWTAVGSSLGFGLLYLTNAHAAGVTALLGQWGLPLVGLCVLGTASLMLVPRRLLPKGLVRGLALDGTGPLVPLCHGL